MAKNESSIEISGGTFTGVNIAGRDVHVGDRSLRVRPKDLRAALAQHRAELVEAAGAEAGQAQRRLDRLDEELAEDEPDAGAVHSGWKAVTKLLAGAAAAAESVKKITELVHAVFP